MKEKITVVNDCQPVSHEEYDEKYYLTDCGGHHNFVDYHGLKIDERISRSLKLANIEPDMTVLDVGSGRGEIVLHCALNKATAIGIDYSTDATKLAASLRNKYKNVSNAMFFMRGVATKLPFKNATFDRIFLLDLVEHLHEQELEDLFKNLSAIIKDEGIIIVHTAPNKLYYEYGYKLIRFFLYMLKGVKLENDIRSDYEKKMHINEQTSKHLGKLLKKSGFGFKIGLFNTSHADLLIKEHLKHPLLYKAINSIINWPPLANIFCRDIYAVAWKNSNEDRLNYASAVFEDLEKLGDIEYRPSSKVDVIESLLSDCIEMGKNDVGVIDKGWYSYEIWPPVIRWTSSKASAYLKYDGTATKLYIEAITHCLNHEVKIHINEQCAKTILLEEAEWKILTVELDELKSNDVIEVIIEVDKTWIPDIIFNNGDTRELGIAVHKIWIE